MVSAVSSKAGSLLTAAAAKDELESLIAIQEGDVTKSVDWLESFGKAAAEEKAKHLIRKDAPANKPGMEPAKLTELFKGIGFNITQDWLKSKGGVAEFAGWFWQGAEVGAAIGSTLGGTVAWPIAVIECGAFIADVWEKQIAIAHSEAVKDLSGKFDRIVNIHTELVRRLKANGSALLKTCEAMPARIVPYWTEGTGDKAMRAIQSGKGHPSGRTILANLVRKAMMKHLLELDAARYELFLLGTNCEAMVKHGQNVMSDPSPSTCGFPQYAGYNSPQRGQLIQGETSQLNAIVQQAAGCNTRLSNVAFNLWSTVGGRLGISESSASPGGF